MKSLPRLKRADGSDPGVIAPNTWNELCDILAEVDRRLNSLNPQSSPSVKIRQTQKGFTAWTTQSGAGGGRGKKFDHMWKVSSAGQSDDDPPVPLLNVTGGILTVQGTTVTVADNPTLSAGTDGFVCLKVVRNSASRAYVSHVIEWHPTTAPASDYAAEYYILASIYDGEITQHRYEEIISHELMIVANGEFQLGPFSTLTRETYEPPEP
jgi:hypothetical protein